MDSDNQAGSDGPSGGSGAETPRSTPRARGLPRDTIIILVASVALVAAVVGVLIGHLALKSSSHGASATTLATSSSTTPISCASWPAFVTSPEPEALLSPKTPPAGVYVWWTLAGWHLRLVEMPEPVSGYVVGGESTVTAKLVGKTGTVKDEVNLVRFSFLSHKPAAGMDFSFSGHGCGTSKLDFALQTPHGGVVPIDQIYIGHAGERPLSDPFSFSRVATG